MSLIPVKYPLDRTGTAPTNLVTAEEHQLVSANYRVLVPRHGAFYTESVAVREIASGRLLRKGVDYYPAMLYKTPTMETGKEIHQLIVITDPTANSNLYFSGQMLGGEYSYSWDAIIQLIQSLKLDQRGVLFENILGKPDEWPPAPHFHDLGDVFGFEYIVEAIERIRQALQFGVAGESKALYDYLDGQIAQIVVNLEAKLSTSLTKTAILGAIGYTPLNRAGDTALGAMTFNKGITNKAFYKEGIRRQTATTAITKIDLSLSSIFDVTLKNNTTFQFDVSKVPAMSSDDSISFTMVVKNDGVGSFAIAFGSNVHWAEKTIPPRTTGPTARDEYYFSSFDGGVTWTGSLSNANVGQAAG